MPDFEDRPIHLIQPFCPFSECGILVNDLDHYTELTPYEELADCHDCRRNANLEPLQASILESCLMSLTSTPVFDTLWKFAAERQAIFHRRAQGLPGPWTDDPVLAEYKFTCPYRAADRVSQYLIRNVIYLKGQPGAQEPDLHTPEEVFFRTMLFKLFNKIDTWEWLNVDLDEPLTHYAFLRGHCHSVLEQLVANGAAVYSPAYMVPSPPKGFVHSRKWEAHLHILNRMMADGLPARLAETPHMDSAFRLMREYPMIGDFLAYQFVTDLNYSDVFPWSEMEFTIPGPGGQGRHQQVLLRHWTPDPGQHHPHDL